jgi:heme/copper-type cytochrome/quinol oxidase subunit 2
MKTGIEGTVMLMMGIIAIFIIVISLTVYSLISLLTYKLPENYTMTELCPDGKTPHVEESVGHRITLPCK